MLVPFYVGLLGSQLCLGSTHGDTKSRHFLGKNLSFDYPSSWAVYKKEGFMTLVSVEDGDRSSSVRFSLYPSQTAMSVTHVRDLTLRGFRTAVAAGKQEGLHEEDTDRTILGAVRRGTRYSEEWLGFARISEIYTFPIGQRILTVMLQFPAAHSPAARHAAETIIGSLTFQSSSEGPQGPHNDDSDFVGTSVRQPTQRYPDYRKWQTIAPGLQKSEVLQKLGSPVLAQTPAGKGFLHDWHYGTVVEKGAHFPREYAFVLTFSGDRLVSKSDPFGGSMSESGHPSDPKLITPADNQTFGHYPRILDLRWYPCAGDYPMEYDVEVGVLAVPGDWTKRNYTAIEPYLAVDFPGMTRGRWRVRGVNSRGKGMWSEYRYFEFTK